MSSSASCKPIITTRISCCVHERECECEESLIMTLGTLGSRTVRKDDTKRAGRASHEQLALYRHTIKELTAAS